MLIYIKDALVYILPASFVWLIGFIVFQIILYLRKERVSSVYSMTLYTFSMYMTTLFAVTVSPMYGLTSDPTLDNVNIIPFQMLNTLYSNPLNVFGNIVMFSVVGVLLVFLSVKARKLIYSMLFGFFFSTLIECVQLFLGRGSDVDDIMLNVFGTMLGYFIGIILLNGSKTLRSYFHIRSKKLNIIIKNDMKVIISFTLLILIAVMMTGLYKRNLYMEKAEVEREDSLSKHKKKEEKQMEQMAKRFHDLNMEAEYAYLIHFNTKTILYEKNSHQKIAPASTTKLLTALVVLDHCSPEEEVLVGDEIKYISEDASKAGIRKGNVITVKQLLDGLLLPSGNDAAYTLATYTGKKLTGDDNVDKAINKFVEAMNEKARSIGAKNSNFRCPDGYDKQEQYTTAKDLGLIASEFLSNQLLKEIVSKESIRDVFPDGTDVTYHNTNQLLNPNSPYYLESAIGLKTGRSSEAGSCLVSAATIKGETYISIIMKSSEEGRWQDSISLYSQLK